MSSIKFLILFLFSAGFCCSKFDNSKKKAEEIVPENLTNKNKIKKAAWRFAMKKNSNGQKHRGFRMQWEKYGMRSMQKTAIFATLLN